LNQKLDREKHHKVSYIADTMDWPFLLRVDIAAKLDLAARLICQKQGGQRLYIGHNKIVFTYFVRISLKIVVQKHYF